MPTTLDDLAQEVRLLRSGVADIVGDGGDGGIAGDVLVEGGTITAYDSGTGIATVLLDNGNTIDGLVISSVAGSSIFTNEQVRDVIGAALVAGTNITITVNDPANTITIASDSTYA